MKNKDIAQLMLETEKSINRNFKVVLFVCGFIIVVSYLLSI